jgi:hypothetical protein
VFSHSELNLLPFTNHRVTVSKAGNTHFCLRVASVTTDKCFPNYVLKAAAYLQWDVALAKLKTIEMYSKKQNSNSFAMKQQLLNFVLCNARTASVLSLTDKGTAHEMCGQEARTWCHASGAGRSRVQDPMMSLNFCNLPNPSSCTMTLGFTQPLTEMSTIRSFWNSGSWGWQPNRNL